MSRETSFRLRVAAPALAISLACAASASAQPAAGPPVFAGIFGSRNLTVENPNNPGTNYTMVQHVGGSASSLAYDAGRGWGFEVTFPDPASRPYPNSGNDGKQFGPFDDSANNRNEFDDTLPDQLYDSFIGFKDYTNTCDMTVVGDPNSPCAGVIDPEGGVFRIDVPNGRYRFVGVFGDADNHHAHRILVENGGSGPASDGIGGHVVLVSNHDQAQFDIGMTQSEPNTGDGVFAAVGFLDKKPPEPQGATAFPVFVNYDANGLPSGGDGTGPLDSPVLNVTDGHLRVHLLQGNSNGGIGGGRDPNGGDIVLFEVYPVGGDFVLGDVNGDQVVDLFDFAIIRDNFRLTQATLEQGDVNFDRTVDIKDFRVWKDAFNAAGGAAVPEPATMTLLALAGAVACFARRHRKNAWRPTRGPSQSG